MRASPSTPVVTPRLLLRAYAAGLFPMSESAEDPTLFWVDPERRGIFPLDGLTLSRSLRKVVRSDRFTIAIDRNFESIVAGCGRATPDRPSTWINGTIRDLYGALFARGIVHTVEAYRNDRLVGGLYGLAIGGAFFGESMFHTETDASKVCLVHLAARLVGNGFKLLDTQFVTPHLATLGAVDVARTTYHAMLAQALPVPARWGAPLNTALSGADALHILLGGSADQRPAGSFPPNSDG